MYCPKCRKLMKVANYKGIDRYICQSSSCRTAISENKIIQLDIDNYTKISEYIVDEEDNDSLKTFVLLKEKSLQPLLLKNTNNALEKNKNKLCIIQCKSKDEAINIFKSMFNYIVINEDSIAEIEIIFQ